MTSMLLYLNVILPGALLSHLFFPPLPLSPSLALAQGDIDNMDPHALARSGGDPSVATQLWRRIRSVMQSRLNELKLEASCGRYQPVVPPAICFSRLSLLTATSPLA